MAWASAKLKKTTDAQAIEFLGFEARPQTFGLGIIVALAASAMGALSLSLAQQGRIIHSTGRDPGPGHGG